jgi:hypothetical protein
MQNPSMRVALTADGLAHVDMAKAVMRHMRYLPPGSVIAVQGSWGRGKTDILERVYTATAETAKEQESVPPLWLNPWQYGTPDLITPIVAQIVGRLPPDERKRSRKLRQAAKTLLRAGNAMAFKAVSIVAPMGSVIEAGSGPVDEFIVEMFDKPEEKETFDLDPISVMAQRFRELIDQYLGNLDDPDVQLLICVDDLDRCLPDHQIAMLEAIYFLTGARARASFLVALDPTLVQQAAVTHYKTPGFDSNQYLDKLFDLRLTLRALVVQDIESLIELQLNRSVTIPNERTLTLAEALQATLKAEPQTIRQAFGALSRFPELCNPRLIRRIFDRLYLLGQADEQVDIDLRAGETLSATVAWCAIAERWPSLRFLLQAIHPDTWAYFLLGFLEHYDGTVTTDFVHDNRHLLSRLPSAERNPDVSPFLRYLRSLGFDQFATIDEMLVRVGL